MGAKAIAYLRVSGKGQIGGDGFTRQAAEVAKYVTRHGIDLVDTFRDSESGTNELSDRLGLAAALDRIESNGIRLVLVERADRLARDLLVHETILAQFRDLGVKVIAADSGTDLTVADGDPTRTLIRQVLGAVAQFDKSVTVLKLRAARQRIRKRHGRCEGRKPYGDRPGESAVIKRIRHLRRKPRGKERQSIAATVATLNAEHCPTRSGRPWTKGSLHRIITRLSIA